MKREEVAAAAFLGASALYLGLSLSFPFGTPARPGPGFFPVAVGAFLCLVGVAFLLSTLRRRSLAAAVVPEGLPPEARTRVAAATVGLVGFCLVLPWAGYPLAAFVFVALLLKRLGGGGWPAVLGTALVSAVASYYLFAVLLEVPLPRGALFG